MLKSNTSRVAALDGLRGALAVVVLVSHVYEQFGIIWMRPIAMFAVACFFVMSGYVLTRGWTGGYLVFLLRRFIRLWPTYAACLIVGYILAGRQPIWSQFFWYPYLEPADPRHVDPPMWSLIVEAWAMPLMPLIVWAGTGSVTRAVFCLGIVITLGTLYPPAFLPLPFIAGAFMSRADFRNKWLELTVPQWLGKVSYSLYLTHFLVLVTFARLWGPWGSVFATPVAFAVAWIVWVCLENPSILLSRRVGSFVRQNPVWRDIWRKADVP